MQIFKNRKVFALLFLLIPFLFFIKPVISSEFILGDDHEIIRLNHGALNFSTAIENDKKIGRFRPFYWTIRTAQAHIFKDRAIYWHGFNYLLAIAGAIFLFLTLSKLGIKTFTSLFAVWFTFLNLPAVSGWISLGPQEPLATFLLIFSFWILVLKWNTKQKVFRALFFITVIAFSLTKETYILFIPGLVFVNLFIQREKIKLKDNILSAFAKNHDRKLWDECDAFSASADFAPTKRAEKIPLKSVSGTSFFKRNSTFILLMSVVFIVTFLTEFLTAQNAFTRNQTVFGGILFQTLSDKKLLLNNAGSFLKSLLFYSKLTTLISVIAFYAFISLLRGRGVLLKDFIKNYKVGLFLTLGFWLTLILQVIVYSTKTYVSYHYPSPSILIVILWLAFVINYLSKFAFRFQKIIFTLAFLIILISILKLSISYAYSRYYDSKRLLFVLDSIDSFLANSDSIIISANPSYMYEPVYSIKIFLESYGKNYDYYFLPDSELVSYNQRKVPREFLLLNVGKDNFVNSTIDVNLVPISKRAFVILLKSPNTNYDKLIEVVRLNSYRLGQTNEINLNTQVPNKTASRIGLNLSYINPHYTLFFISANK